MPDPAPDQIAIHTHYSGVSIGTEFALIRKKISWGPYPLCTGYMGTGSVVTVGAKIDNFQVGDQVYFRGNNAMTLANGDRVSCVSGAHASHAVLRPNTTHGADHLIPGAALDTAAMFVMPAVGLYGVDTAVACVCSFPATMACSRAAGRSLKTWRWARCRGKRPLPIASITQSRRPCTTRSTVAQRRSSAL